MFLRHVSLAVVVFVALASFSYWSVAIATAASDKSAEVTHAIPFAHYENYVWVPVRINGSEPLQFVLDTGASASVINRQAARALGLSVSSLRSQTGLGTGENAAGVGVAKDATLSLDGIEIEKGGIPAISLTALEQALGHRIDGMLGSEVFQKYVVEIDYVNSKVILHDRRGYRYAGSGQALPLEFKGGRSFVRAHLTIPGAASAEGLFAIDSGANGAVALHSQFIEKNHLLPAELKTIPNVVRGTAGDAPEQIGRAEAFNIGALAIGTPYVAFSTASRGSTADPSYDGVIGGEVLRRFRCIIDYSRRQIVLEPNAAFNEPFDFDMSGGSLIATGAEFKTLTIERVLQNSPMSEAGLHDGDILMAINGVPTTIYSLAQMRRMFRQRGHKYSLRIRRDNQNLEVEIGLRPLI